MLAMPSIDDARAKLKEVFGFEDFLDGQEGVIGEILSGRDGSVVMPTGGGKSLCYQLPALCREGVTLVVSPLIALMKDQVDALEEKGVAVTLINSTLTWPEQKERLEGMFISLQSASERGPSWRPCVMSKSRWWRLMKRIA